MPLWFAPNVEIENPEPAPWRLDKIPFPIWTIYRRPKDFPDRYVVRLFDIERPTEQYALADSLDEARRAIPLGRNCFPQYDPRNPQIVEAWL